jgi:hypothetical protein
MDLIVFVLLLCVIGFAVWFLTTKIPMPPYWAGAIQVLALILIALYAFQRLGGRIPNVL